MAGDPDYNEAVSEVNRQGSDAIIPDTADTNVQTFGHGRRSGLQSAAVIAEALLQLLL